MSAKVKLYLTLFIFLFNSLTYAQALTSHLEQEIDKLLEMLGTTESTTRNLASKNLILIGPTVIPHMVKNFNNRDYLARKQIIYTLGKIGTTEAIEFLYGALTDKDLEVRGRAALSLLELTDTNSKIAFQLEKIKATSPEHNDILADLKQSILYKDIEIELEKLISPQGGYGFYEGQFKELDKKIGKKAVWPLLEIFENRSKTSGHSPFSEEGDYQYIKVELNNDPEKPLQMRLLAGQALAEYGTRLIGHERLRVLDRLRRMKSRRPSQFWAEAVMEIVDYCLYQYGDTSKIDLQIRKFKNQIRRGLKNKADAHFQLGMVYLRIRKIKLGIKELETAIKYAPRWQLAHYNLACGYACAGQREKAIAAIIMAVECGYTDVGWMVLDGDLRSIRNDERFKKLVKKLQEKVNK